MTNAIAAARWPLLSCPSPAKRRRLAELQGFKGLDDATLLQLDPWLRFSPAICMTWAAAGTAARSSRALAALVPFAVAGAVGKRHPFDAIYELGVRRRRGTPSIPVYGAPRRFACAVASVWLAAAAWAFRAGAVKTGTALGASMVAAAAVPTFTGFCIPSWIWGRAAAYRNSRGKTATTIAAHAA